MRERGSTYEKRRAGTPAKEERPGPVRMHLKARDIRCPVCSFRIMTAFEDAGRGHIKLKCQKCKKETVLDLRYFRKRKCRPHTA